MTLDEYNSLKDGQMIVFNTAYGDRYYMTIIQVKNIQCTNHNALCTDYLCTIMYKTHNGANDLGAEWRTSHHYYDRYDLII